MESNGVVLSSCVVITMIVLISRATAEDTCFQNCLNTCHLATPEECAPQCFQKCPVPLALAPNVVNYYPRSEGRCFEKCMNNCHLPKEVECVGPCFKQCPFPPSAAPKTPSLAPNVVINYPLSEGRCFEKCMNNCHLPKEVECVGPCFKQCPFPPSAAPKTHSLAQNVVSYYPLSEGRCFEKCMNNCHLPNEVECVGPCFKQCPFPPSVAPKTPSLAPNVVNYYPLSEGRCFEKCMNNCHLPKEVECVGPCFKQCPFPPSSAPKTPSLAPNVVNYYPLSEGRCFEKCMNNCQLPKEVECVGPCFKQCPFPPSPSPNVVDHLYHCKLGCSLHQCAKYTYDKIKMGSCMRHCSTENCDIKHPSPSVYA